MTPIKASTYLGHANRLAHVCPLIDLRQLNLVHAAPVENDHALLTLRYDPNCGVLQPMAPEKAH